jgi:hypothetical protein
MCKLLLIGPVGATFASCAHVFWLKCSLKIFLFLKTKIQKLSLPIFLFLQNFKFFVLSNILFKKKISKNYSLEQSFSLKNSKKKKAFCQIFLLFKKKKKSCQNLEIKD